MTISRSKPGDLSNLNPLERAVLALTRRGYNSVEVCAALQAENLCTTRGTPPSPTLVSGVRQRLVDTGYLTQEQAAAVRMTALQRRHSGSSTVVPTVVTPAKVTPPEDKRERVLGVRVLEVYAGVVCAALVVLAVAHLVVLFRGA